MKRLGTISVVLAFVAACASAPPPAPPPAPLPVVPLPSWATNITNDGSWVFLGASSGHTLVFYSPGSIRKYHGMDINPDYASDRRLSVWVRFEYESRKRGARSEVVHYDINCNKALSNIDQVIKFPRHNMGGSRRLAYSWQPGSKQAYWVSIPPSTIAASVMRRVCP